MKPVFAAILSRLLVGSAIDRNRADVHGGPIHPGYDLKPGFMRFLTLTFATGFGTGFSPLASGTVGCIPGILLFWYIAPPYGSWTSYLLATVLVIFLGILTASAAEGIYGKKDDGRIVIDEVAGTMVTMLWAPHTWGVAVTGFLIFRFFDVVKVAPAYRIQKLRGGRGIVLDDVVSGLYSCVLLHFLLGAGRTLSGWF